MRHLLLFTFLTLFIGLDNKLSSQIMASQTVNEVLHNVSNKLNATKSISYDYYRAINYFSESYHNEISGKTYLEFVSKDSILGFKYQLESDQYKMIYNGAESFLLNKKEKTMKVTNAPKLSDFSSSSFFVNSIVTLKKALPEIIGEKEISKSLADTIINGKSYFLVTLIVKNKSLNGLGTFVPVTLQRNFVYKLIVDKDNYLPLHIIQANNIQPKDYLLTSFSNFNIDNTNPAENSWYYSTYANEFKPALEKVMNLIKINSFAPDWRLPLYGSNETLKLSQFKDKVVLLEFWIKNCGYCIEAIPKLNSLVKKYKSKKFEILGVNAHDTKEDIGNFYRKNNPYFKTVYDNEKVTSDYGIDAFPTIVLLDKTGKVLYSGNFDQQKIESLLKTALR